MSLEEEKHESPSHCLERIRDALQKHGGMDPERPAFDTLLKVQFVTEAWPGVRKEVQKDEEWKNKPLEKLVRKVPQIYIRDEEKAKAKAKMMAEVLQSWRNKSQGPRRQGEQRGQRGWGQPQGRGRGISSPAGEGQPTQQLGRNQCAVCRAEGHWKQQCPQRQLRRRKSRE